MSAKPRRNNGKLFIIAGFLDLCVGLAFSLMVGIRESWPQAFMLATGFFFVANVLFYLGIQRLAKGPSGPKP